MADSTRTIVITSGKGGVGKTTLTAHLGRALASLGKTVCLIDVDLGLNNLDVLLDVENKVSYDLIDVIEGRCRIKQALIADTQSNGLYILPSAHSYDKSRITGQNIKAVVNSLNNSFDFIILDCPAGIEIGFHRAVASATEALVVVTPHISSLRDADKVINLLKTYQLQSIRVIVNRARGDLIVNNQMVNLADVKTLLKADIAGVLPEDDGVNMLSNLGLVGKKSSQIKIATEILASNICFNTHIEYDVTKQYKGFFGGIKRGLRRNI